jgi:hypothetical protein
MRHAYFIFETQNTHFDMMWRYFELVAKGPHKDNNKYFMYISTLARALKFE